MEISGSNNLLRVFKLSFYVQRFSGPLHSLNGKSVFKYTYLPKLVSTEQFWSTIRTNALLAEI